MKGRITCPSCKHKFIFDIKEDEKLQQVVCPKCKNKFNIEAKSKPDPSKDECFWTEYGEPRKTILSKIKPRTNKPMIAAILLICVFLLGIATSVFSEGFIESTLDAGSALGLDGEVIIKVTDYDNNSLDNIKARINNVTIYTDENGNANFKKVELGIQKIELSNSSYITQTKEVVIFPFFLNKVDTEMTEGSGQEEFTKFDGIGCSLIIGIFSIFALFGAITCIRRRNFDIALVGAAIGIFCFGFFFVGSIISIIAFILIFKSRDEFLDEKKGKTF